MSKETELRKLYVACHRVALENVKCAGITKGFKRAVEENTISTYNACKNNSKLKRYVLSEFGK